MTSTELAVGTGNSEEEARIDRFLLRHAGVKSTTEIAKEIGIPPHEVRGRLTVLLDSIDVLTIQQERNRLMITLNELAAKGLERLDSIGTGLSDREWAQISQSISNSIKVSLAELARIEAKDETKIEALNALRIKELLNLMNSVVTTSVAVIAERFSLDEQELLEIFFNRLQDEAIKYDLEGGA